MNNYKKTFSFKDKENHIAKIDVEITHRNGYPEFTASASYCNSGGQCLDQIKTRTHDQALIIKLWNKYHLKNISKIPANTSFIPSFEGHLDNIIKEIEKEQAKRDQENESKDKTEDEKILDKMEEYGIDESQEEACKSYLECMSVDDLADFEESYSGKYEDDEDFTKQLLDDIGTLPEDLPCYVYINWEKTANAIMQDYIEQDGYYFRNI